MQIKKYKSDLLMLCYRWDFKLISNVKRKKIMLLVCFHVS
jgi:hypothetical protein